MQLSVNLTTSLQITEILVTCTEVMLVNQITWVSRVQVYDASSVYRTVPSTQSQISLGRRVSAPSPLPPPPLFSGIANTGFASAQRELGGPTDACGPALPARTPIPTSVTGSERTHSGGPQQTQPQTRGPWRSPGKAAALGSGVRTGVSPGFNTESPIVDNL